MILTRVAGVFPVLVRATDAEPEFVETKHPRDKDGKFAKGSGGGASKSLPKGMEHFSGQQYKNASAFIQAALKENLASKSNKYNNAQIAEAAQAMFGTKTSPFTVNGYKHAVYNKSPEGQALLAAKKAGVKANNEVIAAAPTSPAAVKAAVANVVSGVTMFASVKKNGVTTFVKLNGVPSNFSGDMVKQYIKELGYDAYNVSEFNPSKPAPPSVTELTISPEAAEAVQKAAKKKAEAEAAEYAKAAAAKAEASKPVTKHTSPITASEIEVIESYTNGAYGAMNKALRNGTKLSSQEAIRIKQLDQAIAKSVLEKPCTLRRGISATDIASVIGPSPKVGDVVMDNGFMSSSKGKGFGGNIRMTINMPAGAHALDVQKWSNHSSEMEVILPRGSMFEIKSFGKTESGVMLEVDYVTV